MFFFLPDYSEDYNALTEEIYLPGDYGPLDTWNRSEIIWTTTNSTSKDFWDNMGNIWMPGTAMPGGMATPRPGIQCIPEPGPFLPCNDLFDWWTLRCSVWIVFLLALLGKIFHKICILTRVNLLARVFVVLWYPIKMEKKLYFPHF